VTGVTTPLRAARTGRGWSQAQLFRRLEQTALSSGEELPGWASMKRQIARWESGQIVPDAYYRALLSQVYSLPESALGLEMLPTKTTRSKIIESAWSAGSTVEAINHFTRRDLVRDIGQIDKSATDIALGPAFLTPILTWTDSDRVEPRPLLSGTGKIGPDGVAQIEEAAFVFRHWSDTVGGGFRRKAVLGQLNEVSDLLRRGHPPNIEKRLLGALSRLAETVAIMSWDSGNQAMAQLYCILSLRAARLADDSIFAANIMASMARQMLYLGHAADALSLINLAQVRAQDCESASVRSMLHTREAWAYAHLGELDNFRRATTKAEEALADRDPSHDPHWIQYYDYAEFSGTTGGRLLDLARHIPSLAGEAAEKISTAIYSRPTERLRSSALDQIGLAEARLMQGELQEASLRGHESIEAVGRTPSDRVQVKLGEFYRLTHIHEKVPEIRDLRERVRGILMNSAATRG
jgi:transcriptional regulator with XRE-family HTH domain